MEKQFRGLEGTSAEVHRKLLKTKDYTKLSTTEKETLATFMAVQYARTDQQRLLGKWVSDEQLVPLLLDPVKGTEYVEHLERKHISKQHEELALLEREIIRARLLPIPVWEQNKAIEELRKQIDALTSQARRAAEELDPANLDDIRRKMAAMLQRGDPDDRRDMHVYQMMVLVPPLFEHIQSRTWQIAENKTDTPLCTSDHPILTIPITAPRYEDLYHALLTLGLPDMGDILGLGESGKYPPFDSPHKWIQTPVFETGDASACKLQ